MEYKTMFSGILLSILLVLICHAQQVKTNAPKDRSLDSKPQRVYRYCYVVESKEWYENQEKLWKSEISKNPKNEDTWYNYYFASRYARMGIDENERMNHLKAIESEIGKAIPNSYLYPYLRYYNDDRKVEHLEKALQLKPDFTDLYWEFIQYYELNGIKPQKKIYCEKLYLSKDIISSLYNYNFNMLNSTEKNSILFTNGDNDTYPAWVLQEAKGVRQDVTVLNVHTVYLLRDYLRKKLEYRGISIDLEVLPRRDKDIAIFFKELILSIRKKYPDIPIHVAPTVYEEYKKEIKDKLFTTGLGYTYSESKINNVALIKKNLGHNLRLDYLEYDWYNENHISQSMVYRFNLNYIPAFRELIKMYYSSGESELAKYWKDKAMLLAKKANNQDAIKSIEELNH